MASILKVGEIKSKTGNDSITIADNGNITTTGTFSPSGDLTVTGTTTLSGDFVPATPLSHRNLIINGSMQVAQRGTSSTTNGYGTVDRFRSNLGNNDENATQSQHVLTSSDTGPYEEGFRRSFRLTNGNQTSGAGTSDTSGMLYRMESRDIAGSGWNYLSSSSYITLSFWCKSSVAQNFYGRLTSQFGTQQNYPFETGSLSANTWTKITKTISGNSNLQFDNTNALGLDIEFTTFRGTDLTGSVSLNTWAAYNASTRVPDMTSTWYTTNDATWEITGVQLERGQVATPFEHRSLADELARCQRYYYKPENTVNAYLGKGHMYATGTVRLLVPHPVTMRTASVTLEQDYGSQHFYVMESASLVGYMHTNWTIALNGESATCIGGGTADGHYTAGNGADVKISESTAYLALSAEL